MKVAFIKSKKNERIYNLSRFTPFSELASSKMSMLCSTPDVCHLGYMLGLKCDFITLEDCPKNLAEYDMLITLDPILSTRYRPDQILCYIECEPFGWRSGNTGVFSATQSVLFDKLELGDVYSPTIVPPYDFLLNNYVTYSRKPQNIPFWCRCFVDDMRTFIMEKTYNKVFINIRTSRFHLKGRALDSSLIYMHELPSNMRGNVSYKRFCEELSTCTFNLNLDDSISAGQITAEASVLGVITLGTRRKLFNKLLLPEYCFISTIDEGMAKIRELMSDKDLYEDVTSAIRYNLPKIDYKGSEEHLLYHIGKGSTVKPCV